MEKTLNELDPLFYDAAIFFVTTQEASTAKLQIRFLLGYNRAGKIMNQLEEAEIIGGPNGTIHRTIAFKDINSLSKHLLKFSVPEWVIMPIDQSIKDFVDAHIQSTKRAEILFRNWLVEKID
jgi:hypothetical protein